MISTGIVLTDNWVELASDGDDFVLQNIDPTQLALIQYSDTTPTTTDNAHRLYNNDKGWLSGYATGKLWGRSLIGNCKIVLTK